MARLIFTTPEFDGQSFELSDGKTAVGRAPSNKLIIHHDSVSAQHCELLCYGREVIVRDLGSTNGTWVDGCRVKGQTAMSNGQSLRVGGVEARLDMPPPPPEKDRTEMTAIYLHARAVRDSRRPAPPDVPVIIRPRTPTEPK